jgi:type VI secretion system secreted protein Hcp
MNYNDLAVKGDVTDEKHVGWIEVNSFQWGVGRGVSSPTGASADRESSAPSVSEVVVTKATDLASPKLLNEPCRARARRSSSTSARPTRASSRCT